MVPEFEHIPQSPPRPGTPGLWMANDPVVEIIGSVMIRPNLERFRVPPEPRRAPRRPRPENKPPQDKPDRGHDPDHKVDEYA